MNVKLLQFSLLVVLLTTGLSSSPAWADCDQVELCEAQSIVTELLDEIVVQQEIIDAHWETLDSALDSKSLSEWYERSLCLVDVVSRYLHIGTLESRLLVAHNKLILVKMEIGAHDRVCHCSEKIQLSARF